MDIKFNDGNVAEADLIGRYLHNYIQTKQHTGCPTRILQT